MSAEARILPSGDQRTAFTLFWCLERSHTHWGSIFPFSTVTSSQIYETVKIKIWRNAFGFNKFSTYNHMIIIASCSNSCSAILGWLWMRLWLKIYGWNPVTIMPSNGRSFNFHYFGLLADIHKGWTTNSLPSLSTSPAYFDWRKLYIDLTQPLTLTSQKVGQALYCHIYLTSRFIHHLNLEIGLLLEN